MVGTSTNGWRHTHYTTRPTVSDTVSEKPKRYLGYGPGWSGATDDFMVAYDWLRKNRGDGAVYIRLEPVDLELEAYYMKLELPPSIYDAKS